LHHQHLSELRLEVNYRDEVFLGIARQATCIALDTRQPATRFEANTFNFCNEWQERSNDASKMYGKVSLCLLTMRWRRNLILN